MPALVDLAARTPTVSAVERGPVVNLVSWIVLTTIILAVGTVLVSKFNMVRKFDWHDALITGAMLSSVGQTVATNAQVAAGLGSPLATLSPARFVKFQKTGYIADILYLGALFFAKASTLMLLFSLTRLPSHRRPIVATSVFILLWAVAAIVASAFRCGLPRPWAYETGACFDQVAFWDAIGACDILSDVAIMVLPVLIVRQLQLSVEKKIAVVFAFTFRAFAIGMCLFRLTQLPHALRRYGAARGSADLTRMSWLAALATMLEIFFSVFSSCIPHLRPFMDSMQAGFLSGKIGDSVHNRSGYVYDNSYAMGKVSKNSATGPLSSMRSARDLRNANGQILVEKPPGIPIGDVVVENVAPPNEMGHDRPWNRHGSNGSEGARSGGSGGSNAMIIKQTKEWSVRYEE